MTDPIVGQTIEQYEVLDRLGGGGMGIVYRARDTRLGRQVALKFLPPQWAHDADAKQRFIREAQAASATDHANICTIHDIGQTGDGRIFIVMALYEGPTLKRRLLDGSVEIETALDIATQVADGLAKAHAAGVVHRDVKPGNVILTEDAVKIVDFGLATFSAALQLTIEGSTLGTAAYMSPEQSRGEEVGPATDVWAVGVMLYEMLAGHPPFGGGSADVITYAIRHDAPQPLRSLRPDVPEEVEQVVFRALMKDPRLRYASGRELARALRQARGQTLPQDLQTRFVQVPDAARSSALRPQGLEGRPSRRWSRRALAAVAALAVAAIAGGWWAMQPPERTLVLVAPVANQTGEADLDPYRLALTHAMVRALGESPTVRPVAYEKMLQALRKYQQGAADIGSRDALQALVVASGAPTVVMPAVLYDDRDRTWRGRIEIRDAATATATASYETARVTSALSKDTAYGLTQQLVTLVNEHVGRRGVRGWLSRQGPPTPLASIEAERAFESGISWYEEQEYAAALDAFREAAKLEAQDARLHAWVSRVALVMRRDDVAREAAEQASRLLTAGDSPANRLFVEAVVAEARRQFTQAEEHLRELAARDPRQIDWRLEIGAYRGRRAETRDGWMAAVADYQEALREDPARIRAHLELCRLYNRLREPANAKRSGELALSGYRSAGWKGAEALARFCLVDGLSFGTSTEQQEARAHADVALAILQESQHPYNLSRAFYYQGMVAAGQRRFPEASTWWERAVEAAAQSGNVALEPLLFMNLGVLHSRLGNVAKASAYYEQSAERYERIGDPWRAAQQQANGGMLGIVNGIDVPKAVRNVQNALAVFEKIGDADNEVASLEALAAAHRYAGQYEDAERNLGRALSRAKERNLEGKIVTVTLALARLSFERSDYVSARRELARVMDADGRPGVSAVALSARVNLRLGDLAAADRNLSDAEQRLELRPDAAVRLEVDAARGELAMERKQLRRAREYFAKVELGTPSVEETVIRSRIGLAFVDALEGRPAEAIRALEKCAADARRIGHVAMEAFALVQLGQIYLLQRMPSEAVRTLSVLMDGEANLGTELRAQVDYWIGKAKVEAGDPGGMEHIRTARHLVDGVIQQLPAEYRPSFGAHQDIRVLLE